MKVEKKVISNLHLCYSAAPLTYQGKQHFMVASEKKGPCILFDLEGNMEETIWTEPGGVMSMVQVPGTDGQFLATHKFFSPNDSAEAKIVVVTPQGKGNWEVRTLCDAPFVHRFGIVQRNGVSYLIVCCLKSGHSYKDDWSQEGAVYFAEIPEDFSVFNESHQLSLTLLKGNMLRNHGFSTVPEHDYTTALVTCEQGVFLFIPPAGKNGKWGIRNVVSVPTSDAVLYDFDGDGKLELGAINTFHGNYLTVYHLNDFGNYVPVFTYGESCEMLHAIWAGDLCGQPSWVVGHRKGKRSLMCFAYDTAAHTYKMDIIDTDCGSANVMHFINGSKEVIVSANRETDTVAMYTVTL